jgi:transcriptional regulator with XRE-family HTH domain
MDTMEKFWASANADNPEMDAYIEKSFNILDRIHELLAKEGISQRELASRLGKNEAEISRWLNGSQNFTLKTIVKLEVALRGDILAIPGKDSRTISRLREKITLFHNRYSSYQYQQVTTPSKASADEPLAA